MMDLRRFLLASLLPLGLIACGSQDPEPVSTSESRTQAESPASPTRAEPADRPPPPEPGSEQALEPDTMTQALAQREQLRQRRQDTGGWWEDDGLSEALGLDPEQRAALLEARKALLAARMEGRGQLQEQRSTLRATEGEAQSERLAELRQSRTAIHQEIEQAERRWQEDLRQILSTEQLDRLRAQQPDALQPETVD